MDWYPLWNSLRIALISCTAVFFLGIFAAYYNKANPYIAHVDYGNLAPGNVYDLSAGGLLRKYP